jgi:hypothetical protein
VQSSPSGTKQSNNGSTGGTPPASRKSSKETQPPASKHRNSLNIRAGDGGRDGSPGGSVPFRAGDGGSGGSGGDVLIGPEGIQKTSGQNSPAVGTIAQGPGSIAQVGGSGNQATVNNFAPPVRHLQPDEIKELHQIADDMPNDAASWFYVETLSEAEAATFSNEIYDIFKDKSKVAQGPVRWITWTGPAPKGTTVCVLKDGSNFDTAQKLANVFAKYQPTGANFSACAKLTPNQVKVIIGVP